VSVDSGGERPGRPLRICIVYDCLYPFTVGGAERWYRSLAAEFARAGHRVTYLTRQQWATGETPGLDEMTVEVVSRRDNLYAEDGRRRIGPPVRFGLGVFLYLVRHRRDFDVVHTCSFPYFSVLAIRLALIGRPVKVGVDWFEYWSDAYWTRYLGGLPGRIGALVQRGCARVTPLAFVTSQRHADRLRAGGVRGQVVHLGGLYGGRSITPSRSTSTTGEPTILYAGRLITEKQADLIGPVLAIVRVAFPGARGLVIGDGPARPAVERSLQAAGVADSVRMAGFVSRDEVDQAMASASCLLLPSAREGYGLVVIEAAAAGTPSVVVDGQDNAAAELIVEGVNGYCAPDADPTTIARAVAAVLEGGDGLRASTRAWYDEHETALRVEGSARMVLSAYSGGDGDQKVAER
jgi:glycosyltransferase involved in cell wall biosynthesis